MIDDSKNFFLDLMRKWDDDYQPERFYKLLDVAKDLVQTYLKVKDSDKCREPFHELVLDTFGQECQQAKSWIRQDIGHNPNVATEAKVTYLKDWTAYIDRIYSWISSAFKNGQADLLEYKRLENLRDGLWEQSNFFCQADTHYLETKADQLKEKITRLTTRNKADLPSEKPAGTEHGDEWIKVSEAAEILSVNTGTVTRWANKGRIKDNENKGRKRRVLKSSVLFLKQSREDSEVLKDAKELRKDTKTIPDQH